MKIKIENSKYQIVNIFDITSDYQKGEVRSKLSRNKTNIPGKITVAKDNRGIIKTRLKSDIFEKENGIDELLMFDEAWYVHVGETVYPSSTLTDKEVRVVLCLAYVMAHTTSLIGLERLEKLVRATKIPSLIESFYQQYSSSDRGQFRALIKGLIESNYDFSTSPDVVTSAYQYSKDNNYSVVTLLSDLVRTKSKVYFDPELTGEYKKMSSSTPRVKSNIPTSWNTVIKTIGNLERANLTLKYFEPYDLTIPANSDLSLSEEIKKVKVERGVCIIKDGILYQSKLAVKVSDKELLDNLKAIPGLIRMTLLQSDEVLLDLRVLPVITLPEIGDPLPEELADLYERRLKVRTRAKILKSLLPVEEVDPETTDKLVKYYKSLGLEGDIYQKPSKTKVKSGNYTVSVIEHPSLSYRKTMYGSNYMDTFKDKSKEEIESEIAKFREEDRQLRLEIGQYVFRLIMSKKRIDLTKWISLWEEDKNNLQKIKVEYSLKTIYTYDHEYE